MMPKIFKCLIPLLLCFSGIAVAQSYEKLYSSYRGSLYQIRLIEQSSNSKAGLGSGFQISTDGLIATNYHVISAAISDPDKYQLKYLSVDGEEGELELLHVDVINDLALLRQKGKSGAEFLQLSTRVPNNGETIVALGNPLDLGMTLVPGTYNGIAAGSFYDRIHFSGAINPGMSGGPVINSAGQVVGINVTTAGNQISFLVPVDKLAALLKELLQKSIGEGLALKPVIHQHLIDNQQRIMDAVLSAEWKLLPLGEAMVVGEILPSLQCWGDSEKDEKNPVEQIVKGCTDKDVVYLSETFNTGRVEYEFFWLQAKDLQPARFYSEYQRQMSSFYPGNSAAEDDVTNFQCLQKFTTQPRIHQDAPASQDKAQNQEQPQASGKQQPVIARTAYCARRYRNFPDLYDIFYVSLTVDQQDRALVSHFTLSGFTQDAATAFSEKFTSEIQWH